MSYNIVRQTLAVAIVFYSIKYIKENQPWRYLLGCVLATGIHSSAFITLSFYLLKDNNGTDSRLLYNKIVRLVVLCLPLMVSVLISFLSSFVLFENYFEDYDLTGTRIIESYILKLPVLLPLLINYKKLSKTPQAKFLYRLYIMVVIPVV